MPVRRDLDWVMARIEAASRLLEEAESAAASAVEAETAGVNRPECAELESLVHASTHEAASNLGLSLAPISRLRERIALRRSHSFLRDDEFEAVLSEGWSMGLVRSVSEHNPDMALAELSGLLRKLEADWR